MSELYLDEVLLSELRGILDEEFPALIATYIQDSRVRLEELQQAFQQGNAEAVRKAAHSLKGASANLGLVYLTDLCQTLEMAAREERLQGQEACLLQVQQEQERAVALLRDRL